MADDRGPQLEGALIGLFVCAVVSVSLRIYTHGAILRHLYAEDWLSLVTLVRASHHTVRPFLSLPVPASLTYRGGFFAGLVRRLHCLWPRRRILRARSARRRCSARGPRSCHHVPVARRDLLHRHLGPDQVDRRTLHPTHLTEPPLAQDHHLEHPFRRHSLQHHLLLLCRLQLPASRLRVDEIPAEPAGRELQRHDICYHHHLRLVVSERVWGLGPPRTACNVGMEGPDEPPGQDIRRRLACPGINVSQLHFPLPFPIGLGLYSFFFCIAFFNTMYIYIYIHRFVLFRFFPFLNTIC